MFFSYYVQYVYFKIPYSADRFCSLTEIIWLFVSLVLSFALVFLCNYFFLHLLFVPQDVSLFFYISASTYGPGPYSTGP